MILSEKYSELSPENNLRLAVLERAIRDIVDFNKSKRCGESAAKRQAWTWLKSNSRNQGWFTFLGICEDLDMDPAFVRNEVFARIQSPRPAPISSLPRTGRRTPVRYSKRDTLERDQEDLSQQSEASDLETSDQPAYVSILCAVGKSR